VRSSLHRLVRLIIVSTLALYAILSASRVVSMTRNYGAPLKLYYHLYHHGLKRLQVPPDQPVRLCVGAEW
jgi:hypothetical protein